MDMKYKASISSGILISSLVCMGLFFGCNNKPANGNTPKSIIFAVIPSDDYTGTINNGELICKYLERKLKIKVRLYKATDYTTVIEAMKTNHVQIAHFGPFSYVLANRKAGAESMVCVGEKSNVIHSYRSLLLSNSKSNIRTIEDVKVHCSELSLSFVDPASTSGHLIPRAFLNSIKLDPDLKFRQVVFSNTHGASILTLISGKVDIAAASDIILERLIARGKINRSDVNILWTSDPIPPDPFCIKSDLDPAFKNKVKVAFLEFPEDDPEGWKKNMHFEFKGDDKAESYIYIDAPDSFYNPVRKIFDNIDYEKIINAKK